MYKRHLRPSRFWNLVVGVGSVPAQLPEKEPSPQATTHSCHRVKGPHHLL